MGLLAAGIMGGLGDAMGAAGNFMLKQAAEESAFQRNMQMMAKKLEMESEQRRADKTWDAEFQDSRDAAKRARIEGRSGELAQARSAGDIAKLDSVGAEYDSLLKSGKMTQEQYDAAQQGLQGGRGLLSRATNADLAEAAARETGSYGDLYKMEKDAEATAYSRQKDERDFNLREKQIAAQLAESRARLSESTLKETEKKEARKLLDLYGAAQTRMYSAKIAEDQSAAAAEVDSYSTQLKGYGISVPGSPRATTEKREVEDPTSGEVKTTNVTKGGLPSIDKRTELKYKIESGKIGADEIAKQMSGMSKADMEKSIEQLKSINPDFAEKVKAIVLPPAPPPPKPKQNTGAGWRPIGFGETRG